MPEFKPLYFILALLFSFAMGVALMSIALLPEPIKFQQTAR